MTIRKGEPWGSPATRPHDLTVAGGDAELAELVAADPGGAYRLSGGDLHRSLGAPPEREQLQRLPIDALRVGIDDRDVLCVAHVIVRNSWWRGRLVAVTNSGTLGSWNVAPRAHPNDGRFDVVEVSPSMSLRQRLEARRRVRLGTHVPHPDITWRATDAARWDFDEPHAVWVDGVRRGRCRTLTVTILPDHFAIYI